MTDASSPPSKPTEQPSRPITHVFFDGEQFIAGPEVMSIPAPLVRQFEDGKPIPIATLVNIKSKFRQGWYVGEVHRIHSQTKLLKRRVANRKAAEAWLRKQQPKRPRGTGPRQAKGERG